jgi:hypothetical protein
MRLRILAAFALCAAGAYPQQSPAPQVEPAEQAGLRQLLTVRRVYVDRLTGDETAAQMRDILIAALDQVKLFVITENQDRADFTMRGAAEDLIFTDVHSSSDSLNVRANAGTGRTARNTAGPYGGIGVGESESDRSAERRHEAVASVRLVNKDGDVVWSTTQESLGAKFRGASADVAEKITTKLKEDFERARKLWR